ncbi:MAG: PH domain-containing protein [Acidimicrobiales bacterium]
MDADTDTDHDSQLSVDERWFTPSPKLLAMRRAELVVIALALVLVALGSGAAGKAMAAGAVGAGAVMVLAVLTDPVLRRRYHSWGYCERSGDLLVRRGVMFRRLTVVPYGRMQLIDVTAGAVERVFGLQTVRLHTAAAATDARIPGLSPAEATRLRDRLASLGEAQVAGI